MPAADKPAATLDSLHDSELDDLAFAIYRERVGKFLHSAGEPLAIDSYRKAEEFLRVRDAMRAGELTTKKPTGPQLSEVSAPNLKPTHPHNLVSQRFGDLQRVNRIKQWLDKNPTPEADPQELTSKFNREFGDLGWATQDIALARTIFPEYAAAN